MTTEKRATAATAASRGVVLGDDVVQHGVRVPMVECKRSRGTGATQSSTRTAERSRCS